MKINNEENFTVWAFQFNDYDCLRSIRKYRLRTEG